MGPKVKKTSAKPKSDWIQCSETQVYHHVNNQTDHSKWLADKLQPKCYPTIKQGVFHSPTSALTLKRTDVPFKRLPQYVLNRSVFLPVPVMKICGIGFGDHVIVEGSGSTPQVFLSWPQDISPAAVMATRDACSMLPDNEVSLKAFSEACNEAENIVLEFTNQNDVHFATEPAFKTYTSACCKDFIFRKDNILFVQYYGKDVLMRVKSISTNEETVSSSGKDICSLLQNVSLNESFDNKTKQDLRATSTPSKPLRPNDFSVSYALIVEETQITFDVPKEQKISDDENDIFKMLGGLDTQLKLIEEAVRNVFSDSTKTSSLRPSSGILIWGPPGTGKSKIGRLLARHMGVSATNVVGSELFSKFYGDTEKNLGDRFAEAKEKEPCIIFIDELEALCPKRDSGQTDQERRVVSKLLSLIDEINVARRRIVVLAATNKPDFIDPSLRRPGRLDLEIELGVPTAGARKDILEKLLTDSVHELSSDDLHDISMATHGFVGADLEALCTDAEMNQTDPDKSIARMDFDAALKHVKPSAMREVMIEVPNVTWNDIGGMEELKLKLKQAVEWPLKHPEEFERMGIRPPKGVLMYGPPGCSKTMIAKALANESGLNFLAIKGPELFSKWVGESERAVRELFRKAREVSPSIVFFDEIDALGSERGNSGVGDRVLTQLLTEMDGIEQLRDVTIVAATNRPDMIDKALMRPGRLDRVVYVPLPDAQTRKKVFEIHTKRVPAKKVDFGGLVDRTEGYSGAEIAAICNEAALKALEEDVTATVVEHRHFEVALKVVKPRIRNDLLEIYKKFQEIDI